MTDTAVCIIEGRRCMLWDDILASMDGAGETGMEWCCDMVTVLITCYIPPAIGNGCSRGDGNGWEGWVERVESFLVIWAWFSARQEYVHEWDRNGEWRIDSF